MIIVIIIPFPRLKRNTTYVPETRNQIKTIQNCMVFFRHPSEKYISIRHLNKMKYGESIPRKEKCSKGPSRKLPREALGQWGCITSNFSTFYLWNDSGITSQPRSSCARRAKRCLQACWKKNRIFINQRL